VIASNPLLHEITILTGQLKQINRDAYLGRWAIPFRRTQLGCSVGFFQNSRYGEGKAHYLAEGAWNLLVS
jgi:hypothetical protein